MASHIKDINLWESGELKLSWVRAHMPLLDGIQKDFRGTQPFKGLKVALSVHLEAKTAHLCEVLAAGGATMYITGSNPLSTQDDVAAALAHQGLHVFAIHGCNEQEYFEDIRRVLEAGPNIIIDDGGDLVTTLHREFPELIPGVIGGCEETTTGVHRLYQMMERGELLFGTVETWLISAALPLFLTALTESPPPMIETPPLAFTVATASQTP